MIKATEAGRTKAKFSIWKPHNKHGLDSSEYMLLNGRACSITNEQGFLVYHLLRGGIEDPLTVSVAMNIPVRQLPDLGRLFLFFDNMPGVLNTAPRQLPAVADRCPIICKKCDSRCYQLPCVCGRADLTISREESKAYRESIWCERGDRRWASASERIASSESAYHGGYID